jgi:hypothetical protein
MPTELPRLPSSSPRPAWITGEGSFFPDHHLNTPHQVYPDPDSTLPTFNFVRPTRQGESIALVAHDADGTIATLQVPLFVVPNALHARVGVWEGTTVVRIDSPVERKRAYVSVVSETERLLGGTVALTPMGDGTARGEFKDSLPTQGPAQGPLWVVVSSEPTMSADSIVGWPIQSYSLDGAPRTFDVPDVLVLDTVGDNVARELVRAFRVRLAIGVLAAAGFLVGVSARNRRSSTKM